ncbi:hypothetical protein GCM10010912_18050 [Paenibacillus albidus]|uniref:Uncharacterized protein n=1 Tax=Paenibacillus albidus TaxID=2041023 RepID=A0A917C726_9BACL|nr:hypothetical protein [Paenibacillus albidus]GGF73227.1 hypothetical protein GCM10010912_18050 [Paenibacillus albidus]
MTLSVTLENRDIEKYLDEHDKSELSRIIWKMEQLKAAENDPNQLQAELLGNDLVLSESGSEHGTTD